MLGMVKAGMEEEAGGAAAATWGKLKPASLQAVVETQRARDKCKLTFQPTCLNSSLYHTVDVPWHSLQANKCY